MQHSGFNRLVGQLQAAWKKDHADRVDDVPAILWEFVPFWLEDAFEGRELQCGTPCLATDARAFRV